MSRKTRRDKLAEQLTITQQKAAYMLLDNELISKGAPDYKTQDEIAAGLGVHRATLFRWRKENQKFIEVKKEGARDYMGDVAGQVTEALRDPMIRSDGAPP